MKTVQKILFPLVAAMLIISSCTTQRALTRDEYTESVRSDLPFAVSNLTQVNNDNGTYRFSCDDYVPLLPDYEVDAEGAVMIYRTTFMPTHDLQSADYIWRNVVISKRNKRVLCIDRLLRDGKTFGFIYVLQSEDARFPQGCHWDVTDQRLMLFVADIFRDETTLSVELLQTLQATRAQLSFNQAISKADSCFMAGDFAMSSDFFTLAFRAPDSAPQNFHYSNAAEVAARAGDTYIAFERLYELTDRDKNWYVQNFASNEVWLPLHNDPRWQPLCDTVTARQARIEKDYDHALISRLNAIQQRDQQPRHAYLFALQTTPENRPLLDSLIREMQAADSVNILEIKDILTTYGFPKKSKVGTANTTIWMIIQHSDNIPAFQRECLPMLTQAALQGEIDKWQVAMLEDRIALSEGRPQKYGSQIVTNEAGKQVIYTLLDPEQVDRWRAEAGMEPLQTYATRMHAALPHP